MQTCCACGYRSAARAFFRREKVGVFGRRKTFCGGCQPHRQTKAEAASLTSIWMFLIGLLLIAAGGLVVGMGYFLLLFGSIGVWGIAVIIVHEAGHAVAARLVGMTVAKIVIGTGPLLWVRRAGDTRLELRTYWACGGMIASYHRSEAPAKWRQAVMVFGGALGNLLAMFTAIAVFAWLFTSNIPISALAIGIGYGFIGAQFLGATLSLLPRRSPVGAFRLPSDGRCLVNLVRSKDFGREARIARYFVEGMAMLERGEHSEACRYYELAHRALPEVPYLLSLLLHAAHKAQGPRAALDCYFAATSVSAVEEDGDKDGVAWVNANVAWNAVLIGDRELLPLADPLSQKAIAQLPQAPEVQGTRGAVLVEMGDGDAGAKLLLEAVRRVEARDDKALFAQYLAKAVRQTGETELADEFIGLARFLANAEPVGSSLAA
jgi:hypothetical protein